MALIDENASLEEVQAVFKNDRFATDACGCRVVEAARGPPPPRAPPARRPGTGAPTLLRPTAHTFNFRWSHGAKMKGVRGRPFHTEAIGRVRAAPRQPRAPQPRCMHVCVTRATGVPSSSVTRQV